jgi:hypothetical protein
MATSDWEGMLKAITAGYGTDMASLVGGGALRLQSLEHTLMSVVQSYDDFVLFNRLKKSPAGATVEEWTEKTSVGGRPGSGFSNELDDITERSASYDRKVALVKYLMTRKNVSIVQLAQKTIIEAKADEEVNGTLQLLTSAEWGCFYGNSAVVGQEFDGIQKAIDDTGLSDHVIDAGGLDLGSAGFQHILNGAQTVRKFGNFGKITDVFLSTAAQTDLDLSLDPAFRVMLDNNPASVSLGAPVAAIKTSFGNIKTNPDIFVVEGAIPYEAESPAGHTTTNPTKPQSLSPAQSTDASSKWSAAWAGNYYWGVASINAYGQSDLQKTAQQSVAAGDKWTITITASAAQDETGYAIFRSRKGGTNASADLRLVKRIARTGTTTLFVDLNADIPGTSIAFLLNMAPQMEAIGIRQLLPMTRFQLYPTTKAEDPWAQLLFMYLRVTKARQHVYIKNILPATAKATWNPLG